MYVGVAVDWSASQSPLNTLNLLLLSNHSHLRRHGETKQKSLIASMFAEQPEVSLLASLHLTIYVESSRILRVPLDSHHKPQPNKEDNNNNKTISKLADKKKTNSQSGQFWTRESRLGLTPQPQFEQRKEKKKRTNIAIDLDTRLTVMNTYQKSNT